MRKAIAFTSATVLGGLITVVAPLSPFLGSGGYMN